MKLYGLKTCGTCRKALSALTDVTFVDVRKEGVPEEVLARAESAFGDKLLNTRSTTWRGLSEEERAMPSADLLRTHPTLIKRPLIETADGTLYLGWTAEVEAALT